MQVVPMFDFELSRTFLCFNIIGIRLPKHLKLQALECL
jgi:hypothetical protein